jgi:rfaE bifunctional protein nucleotidyltransferase chain/domain/rfaE bifunctional protein kinase chain/domain
VSVRLTVVGDTLLDRDLDGRVERLCPEAPVPVVDAVARRSRPGGAGLAAALVAADGHEVMLVTALAHDEGGWELSALLEAAGVEVVDLGLASPTPEKLRVRCDDRLLLRIDDGGDRRAVGTATSDAVEAMLGADGVLVSDYGRGITAEPTLRATLARSAPASVVWDPHPLGARPVRGCDLVTPNLREAGADGSLEGAERRARTLRTSWSAAAVALTMGANGALVVADGPATVVPAPPASGGDPCGAGDRFAATAAARLAAGEPLLDAVSNAVASASAFVAAGGAGGFELVRAAAVPLPAEFDAVGVAERIRARGGRVVATGGCFDLVHAGHVATLNAARALGDCLIVCLNSDASVRRLKGPDRPLVSEDERAAVLRALRCVDAVAIFDEDTPAAALESIRPHVFAKGGDYTAEELPEAAVVARWGGEVAILPYVEGRSTTRLLEEAAARAG